MARRRSLLGTNDAETIANKLGADIDEDRAKHAIAIIKANGKEVGRFGIRRGMSVGHDFIPRQIGINMRLALEVARCTKSRPEYEQALKNRKLYPT